MPTRFKRWHRDENFFLFKIGNYAKYTRNVLLELGKNEIQKALNFWLN